MCHKGWVFKRCNPLKLLCRWTGTCSAVPYGTYTRPLVAKTLNINIIKKILFLASLIIISLQIGNCQKRFDSIPSIEIETLSGAKTNLQVCYGIEKNAMIVFSWGCCWGPPCQRVLDSLEKYFLDWEKKYNIKIFSINYKVCKGNELHECIKKVLDDKRWTFPFYWDNDDHSAYHYFNVNYNMCPQFTIIDYRNKTFETSSSSNSFFVEDVERNLSKLK